MSTYVEGMLRNAAPSWFFSSVENYNSSLTHQQDVVFYSPIIAHANFCVDKMGALNVNKLWLTNYGVKDGNQSKSRQISTCAAFHISNTFWGGKMNWTREILVARKEMDKISELKDNSVVKYSVSSKVYLVRNRTAHLIPSAELFIRLGLKWKDVIKLNRFYHPIPIGPPLDERTGDVV